MHCNGFFMRWIVIQKESTLPHYWERKVRLKSFSAVILESHMYMLWIWYTCIWCIWVRECRLCSPLQHHGLISSTHEPWQICKQWKADWRYSSVHITVQKPNNTWLSGLQQILYFAMQRITRKFHHTWHWWQVGNDQEDRRVHCFKGTWCSG